jgi:hypothetical protein
MASAPNQKVLIMPVETGAFIGSLAGIAEIAKSAFEGSGSQQNRFTVPPTGTPRS